MHLFSGEEGEKNEGKRHTLVLPLDTTALLLVVTILLLALSFSLGVEKGRRNAFKSFEKERLNLIAASQTPINTQLAINQQTQSIADTAAVAVDEPVNAVPAIPEQVQPAVTAQPTVIEPAVVSAPVKQNQQKKYIIQVASYAAKEPAEAAMKKIRSEGYPAFVAQKGKFLAILVGEFKDERSAKSSFESLRKKYKDCILKKI